MQSPTWWLFRFLRAITILTIVILWARQRKIPWQQVGFGRHHLWRNFILGIGMMLAAILFIIQYSRVNIIRHVLNGDSYYSIVERSPSEKSVLRNRSDWIYILELQGFIFFGSTQNLLDFVHKRFHDPASAPPR